MIEEDYVSFETAKLLKEKGFDDIPVYTYYLSYGGFYMTPMAVTNKDLYAHGHIAAPTLQMAMKWLREVHKLYCDIRVGDGDFVIDIMSLKDGEFGCEVVEPECCVYLTYEEACEAAIKHCLENLI